MAEKTTVEQKFNALLRRISSKLPMIEEDKEDLVSIWNRIEELEETLLKLHSAVTYNMNGNLKHLPSVKMFDEVEKLLTK